MFLVGLGALLVLGRLLYMVRAAIWRGPLSGRGSSRPARDTLEPPRRGLGFLGVGTNWPGILLMAIGSILLVSGAVSSLTHPCGMSAIMGGFLRAERIAPAAIESLLCCVLYRSCVWPRAPIGRAFCVCRSLYPVPARAREYLTYTAQ